MFAECNFSSSENLNGTQVRHDIFSAILHIRVVWGLERDIKVQVLQDAAKLFNDTTKILQNCHLTGHRLSTYLRGKLAEVFIFET